MAMNHPNILSLLQVGQLDDGEGEGMFHLVLQFAPFGNLQNYLGSHGALKEKHAKILFGQLAGALGHMHQNSVIHRDIKCENLLLLDPSGQKLLVSDLGSSTICAPGEL